MPKERRPMMSVLLEEVEKRLRSRTEFQSFHLVGPEYDSELGTYMIGLVMDDSLRPEDLSFWIKLCEVEDEIKEELATRVNIYPSLGWGFKEEEYL
jgi:hypothetical protein